jgi:hypothetical protein
MIFCQKFLNRKLFAHSVVEKIFAGEFFASIFLRKWIIVRQKILCLNFLSPEMIILSLERSLQVFSTGLFFVQSYFWDKFFIGLFFTEMPKKPKKEKPVKGKQNWAEYFPAKNFLTISANSVLCRNFRLPVKYLSVKKFQLSGEEYSDEEPLENRSESAQSTSNDPE